MLAGKNVLVVEDEPLIALVLEDFLEGMHVKEVCIVRTSEHGLQALNADETQFDLAMVDFNLANGDTGLPVAKRLVELGIPFVFCTGYSVVENPMNAPVLTKPYSMDNLEKILTDLTK